MRITDEALDAYRVKLRSVAWRVRWAGAALVVLGAAGVVLNYQRGDGHGSPLEIGALVAIAAGWALLAVAFFKRNAYHWRENPTRKR